MIFTFFTISSSSISDLLGYIGALWSDLTPILVVVLGLFLGVFIISTIANIILSKKTGLETTPSQVVVDDDDDDDDFDDDL